MDPRTSDADFEALCARLVAGDNVLIDEIPPQWRDAPQVVRLLGFARVVQGLARGHADGSQPAAPETPDPQAQLASIGQWQLVRKLGSGGMGQVWLGARRDDTAHQVAIKLVHAASPSFATRLIIERQILARLSHPNIARFIDAGIHTDGAPWMALEYVEGSTLSEWCDRARPSLRERLQLFLKICAAVEHAHRHLVVHRDLKPGNIVVDAEGEPRLLDFGIAKLLDVGDSDNTAAALTPAYAAPEQLRGQTITTATDVYALGLLLFRFLAGALPRTREGSNLAQVLVNLDTEETQRASQTAAAHQAELPYSARLLHGDLDAIVSKAMRAAPEARFASVAALAADLQRYSDGLPVLARAPTFRYRCARFVRRNRLTVGLSVLTISALIVGVAVALWQAQLAQTAALLAKSEASKAIEAAETSERVTTFTLKALSQMNPHGRDSTEVKSGAQLIGENIERAKQDLQDDPKAQSKILAKLAEIQSIIDTPAHAEETLRYALGLAATDDEPSDQQLSMRYTLATVLLQQQRYAEAEQELLRLLPSFANNPDYQRYYALGHSNLALIARYTGRTDLAIERLAKAYELASVAYGPEHPNSIELMSNRAMLLVQSGRLVEARASFDSAVRDFEKYQGANFPRLVSPLVMRASVQARLSEFGAARADCDRAMTIAAKVFDATDQQLVRYRINCARTLVHAGDLAGAGSLLNLSSSRAAAQPEIEFLFVCGMAELLLLKHEFNLARPYVTRAQLLVDAKPALAEDRLTALDQLLLAGLGESVDQKSTAAPKACVEDPLVCAAQSVWLQQHGEGPAAFAVFTAAQQELEARQLDPVIFGAYQILMARLSHGDPQAARQWLEMATASLKSASADSEWRKIHAATRASLKSL